MEEMISIPKDQLNALQARLRKLELEIREFKRPNQSLQHFHLLLSEYAKDIILLLDKKTGQILEANQAAVKAYGYERDTLLSRTIYDLREESDKPLVAARLNQIDAQGVLFEATHLRKDGTSFPAEVNSIEVQINGELCLLSIIRDITERKKAEEALRESEDKFRNLFNNAEVGMFRTRLDGSEILDMNQKYLDIFGRTHEEMQGTASAIQWADPKEREEMVRRITTDGRVSEFECKMLDKHGTVRNCLTSLRLYREQGILEGSIIDITERKRVEEALRENQERLNLALQSAHMGVWRWEIKENRRYFDDMTCQLLGIDPATFTGTLEELLRAVHPEDHEKINAVLARTIEQDFLYEPSYRVVWPDGSIHYISARGRLVRDDTGRPARINGIAWDITDQRLLEEERLKTQKLESLGTLAGGIAHDFNNLLQGVFGFISMAKLTFDQREKSLAMLEQAEKALHQSVNLTSQLLTFSKGGMPVKKVFALRPVIESSVAFALSGSRIKYEIVIEENLRPIEADEGQIGQVIQNIVLNADQAMPLGGMIRVSVRNMSALEIVPHGDLQGDLVEISIQDQGAGIPPEYLTRIFDPYFTTKEKGSGLGLATSYSIIKNHGGLIRVKSELGKGTTFFIYLPASNAAVEEPKSSLRPEIVRKAKILVMDDEEIIRAVTGELLTALGHDVEFAETGEAALKTYQAAQETGRPFDVVILDLTIRGGMGGLKTLQKLVEIDWDVKAVVSSGYSDDKSIANYMSQGFKAFLKKPYRVDDLRDVLNKVLDV